MSAKTATTTAATTAEKRVYVVTGTSRGLGLEMVRQIAAEKDTLVFATCRNPDSADQLKKLAATSSGSIELIKLDAADEKSITEGAKAIAAKTTKVHVLINNAGVFEGRSALTTPKEELLSSFNLNVAGPLLVTQALYPLLQAAQQEIKAGETLDTKSTDVPKVVNISSVIGSVQTATTSKGTEWAGFFKENTAYRVSKSALNSLTVCFAGDTPGIAFLAICPGWVDTDMGKIGGGGAISPLKAPESIKGVLSVIRGLTLADSPSYRNHEGKTYPW